CRGRPSGEADVCAPASRLRRAGCLRRPALAPQLKRDPLGCNGHPMTYAFHRTKIPKTLAFPLKRTTLDAALEAAGVADLAAVTFSTRERGDVVLRVEFTGQHRKGWVGAGK